MPFEPTAVWFFLNYNIETLPNVTNNPLVAKSSEYPFLFATSLKQLSSPGFSGTFLFKVSPPSAGALAESLPWPST